MGIETHEDPTAAGRCPDSCTAPFLREKGKGEREPKRDREREREREHLPMVLFLVLLRLLVRT